MPALTCVAPSANAPYRLVNFGWTGNRGGRGSDYTARTWPKLCPEFEVYEMHLPGRGTRISEAPRTDALVLVRELAAAIRAELPMDGKPFAFIGFAFGAILAHETAVEMCIGRGFSCMSNPIPADRPILVCAISCPGPGWPGRRTELHKLDSAAFKAALHRKGGTEEILSVPELVEIFLSVIQADVEIEETYVGDPARRGTQSIVAVHGGRPGRDLERTTVCDADAQLWVDASDAAASHVVALEEHDFFMLEDAEGTRAVLKEVQRFFSKFVAPRMPWCAVACQTNSNADSLARGACMVDGAQRGANAKR